MQSKEFLHKNGLRQEGVLSPVPFNIVLNEVTKELKNKTKTPHVGYRNIQIGDRNSKMCLYRWLHSIC